MGKAAARIAMAASIVMGASFSASAQETEYYRVESGTGFFVNREFIITNAHVVKGCESVVINGAVPEQNAEVTVHDDERDLALIRANQEPPEFAPMRMDIDKLREGDKVLVIGYPGAKGREGHYTVAQAQVMKLDTGIIGAPGQFYITDIVEHGNSGGPVLDTSGNVIGVVVSKVTLGHVNPVTGAMLSEEHAGGVITLKALQQFLFDHGVFTQWSGSGLLLFSDEFLESRAKNYLVNVQCRIKQEGAHMSFPGDAPELQGAP